MFFDLPHPEHLEAMVAEGMRAAGHDPAFVHAIERTGLLATEQQNQHLTPEKDLAAWDAAVREYGEKHRGQEDQGGQWRPGARCSTPDCWVNSRVRPTPWRGVVASCFTDGRWE